MSHTIWFTALLLECLMKLWCSVLNLLSLYGHIVASWFFLKVLSPYIYQNISSLEHLFLLEKPGQLWGGFFPPAAIAQCWNVDHFCLLLSFNRCSNWTVKSTTILPCFLVWPMRRNNCTTLLLFGKIGATKSVYSPGLNQGRSWRKAQRNTLFQREGYRKKGHSPVGSIWVLGFFMCIHICI